MLLQISQNSQENTCVEVSFLIVVGLVKKEETLSQVFFVNCAVFEEHVFHSTLGHCFWTSFFMYCAQS